MIVCVCNALNDKTIRIACASCPRDAACETVFERLGTKPVCGQCSCYIEDVLLPQAHTAQLANANASELLPV